jgi:hypothetical protein
MKATLIFLLLILSSVSISAQDRPNDFYVTKNKDTVLGSYVFVYGSKYDVFRNLKGQKIKIKPDSVLSYSIYLENTYRQKNDPYYYARTWINIRDTFYEIHYKDSGEVMILIVAGSSSFSGSGAAYGTPDSYFFEKKGRVSEIFLAAKFYKNAQLFFADCPSVVDLLDHIRNEKNKEKTHKAKLEDAAFIISRYNECMKH